MTTAVDNQRFADGLISALVQGGVRHALVAPGSRSTPLAAAVHRSGIEVVVHFDERGAAFAALGLAKASGRPVPVICTSGTAAANFLPAAVEASLDAVPLLLLTADRPNWLRGRGAPQTIDQRHLYADFVRLAIDQEPPSTLGDQVPHAALKLAADALAGLNGNPPGPVHLNLQFDEPLSPHPLPQFQDLPADWSNLAGPAVIRITEAISRSLNGARRGIIVAGPLVPDAAVVAAAAELSARTGFPVFADATSNLRYGNDGAVSSYDVFLRHDVTARELVPDLVIQLGREPSSKILRHWITASNADQIVLNHGPDRQEPATRHGLHLDGPIADSLGALASAAEPCSAERQEWLSRVREIDRCVVSALAGAMDHTGGLSEPAIARTVAESLPPKHGLFVSSSMPIRDLDWFGGCRVEPMPVFSNRGANGIDGILSSAAGTAIGLGQPVTLLTGDLALLHDINGLALAVQGQLPLTIVAVNNDGGGIFDMLPVAGQDPKFVEKYFHTPHGLDLCAIARAYGLPATVISTASELGAALRQPTSGPRLIEVPVERASATIIRDRLRRAAHQSLNAAVNQQLGLFPNVEHPGAVA